jgi:peptidoglycan/LPS O-acetylase OafA/YrhL
MEKSPHLVALDGLRGIAALAVIIYHPAHWLGASLIAPHAYLAVDFFFCLSGFIIPFAYRDRILSDGRILDFISMRCIRLIPLMVLSTILGGAYIWIRARAKGLDVPWPLFFETFSFGLLNVPLLDAPASVGGPQVFPLNGPQWSLFLELAANIVWVLTIRLNQSLVSGAFILAGLIGVIALGIGGDDSSNFWSGFPRVALSFWLGVALFTFYGRSSWLSLKPQLTFWPLTLAMIVIFMVPTSLPRWVLAVWIMLISPMLILSGTKVVLTGRLRKVALAAGALSYPLYALHYPVFAWCNSIFQTITNRPQTLYEEPPIFVAILSLASVALVLYDRPVRARLGRLRRSLAARKFHIEVSRRFAVDTIVPIKQPDLLKTPIDS